MRRVLLVGVATSIAWAAPGHAATVRLDVQPDRTYSTAWIAFVADPGERNDVFVVRDSDGSWVLRDNGAPLTVGAGCVALDAGSARCTPPADAAVHVTVDAGDGDDHVHVPDRNLGVQVDAGAGDDVVIGGGTLIGGDGNDTLTGGAGGDDVYGGAGADVLRGAGGDDSLSGDGIGSGRDGGTFDDVLEGGAGNDTATYAGRAASVDGDLAVGAAGAVGEHDRLVGVESLEGGDGDDTLTGDDGPNTLTGNAGADVLSGRGGDDTLRDGSGVDHLDGGAGSDTIYTLDAGDDARGGDGNDHIQTVAGARIDGGDGDDLLSFGGAPQALTCGAGDDVVASERLAGERLDGCERVVVGAFGLFTVAVMPVRQPEGLVLLPVACRAQGTSVVTGCRGGVSLTLRRRGRPPMALGRATFRLPAGVQRAARLRLTRRMRRALLTVAHPLIELQLSARGTTSYRGPGGIDVSPRLTGRWRVRL